LVLKSNNKTASSNEPEKLKLTELVEVGDLQKLQDFFSKSHDVAAVLMDPEGNPVTRSSNYSDFCRIVRSSSLGTESCSKVSDPEVSTQTLVEPRIYSCPNFPDMMIGVVPLTVKGQYLADWHVGQVIVKALDEGEIRRFARYAGLDEEELFKASRTLIKMTRPEFEKVLHFLELLTFQVTLLALQNLEQKKLIFERDKAENALRQSEQRLNLALSSAGLALWDWNISTGDLHINRRWAEMLEYRPEEITPVFNSWKDLIHPGDISGVMSLLYSHLKGEVSFFDVEYRMKTGLGKWKWIHDKGRVVEWENNGNPLRMVGTHIDISERKAAEFELHNKSQEQNILLDNIDVQVWYMKDCEHFGMVNLAFAEFLGLNRSEIQGHSIFEVYGTHAETMANHNREVIKSGRMLKTEEWFKDKDGNDRLFSITRFPKLDGQQKVEFIICTATDITERREYETKLAFMASHDPLTGLYNRHSLEQILEREAGRSKRYNHSMEFLMMDINRFKEINDKFGHQTGDKVLVAVASILENEVRECDLVLRYGGDEFLVILPETSGQTAVLKERILGSLQRWNESNNILTFPLRLSIGCAHWEPGSPNSIEDTLAEADRLMYVEKNGGTLPDRPFLNLISDSEKLGTYRRINSFPGKQN